MADLSRYSDEEIESMLKEYEQAPSSAPAQQAAPFDKPQGVSSDLSGYSDEQIQSMLDQQSLASQAKQAAAAFATGVGKGVPFGQDIPAALGTVLSYTGAGPKYVPTEGTMGERFTAAKKAQREAAERMSEEAPWTSAAGQVTGIAGSLPAFELAAPIEATVAAKTIPYAEKILGTGPYAEEAINAASQGLKGAWQSGVSGLGEGDTLEERIQNAKNAAKWGLGIGAALPVVPKVFGVGKLSAEEEAARRLGAPLPASVGSRHVVTRPLSEALGISPLTKGMMESAISKGQEKLGEALIEKGGFREGVDLFTAGEKAKKAVSDYLTGTHRDLMSQKWSQVQTALGPRANITRTPLTNTKNYLKTIIPQQKRLGFSTAHLEPYLQNATSQRGLIYKDIRELKTKVGENLETDLFQKGKKDRQLEGLYAALEKDARDAAGNIGGPDALKAYDDAVRFSRNMFARRDALAPILGPGFKNTPEQVYNKIVNAAQTNSELVRRARTIINRTDPNAWKDLTSRAAEQLGKTAKNPEWSPGQFVKSYNQISPTGRNVLFGPLGTPQRQVMEDVLTAADRYVKTGKDKHYSKLTLALVTGAAADAAAAAGAISSGSMPAIIATGILSYPVAWVLSQPRLAHAFAEHLNNPANKKYIENFQNIARLYATQKTAPHMEEDRPQRASGGKIGNRDYPAKKLSRVEKALKRAQDALAMETKPIMNVPDEAVAQALHLAKDK